MGFAPRVRRAPRRKPVKKGAFKGVNTKKVTIKVNKKMSKKEFKKLKNYSEKQDFIDKYCLYMSPYGRFTESDKEGWIPSGLP